MEEKYLCFIRHGETIYNQKGIFTGWSDASLSDTGKKDAMKIRKFLESLNIKFDLLISSDLKRSIRTLEIAYPFEAKRIVEPLIRERDYGYLSGKSKNSLKKIKPELYELYHRSYFVPPPAGESFYMVETRIRKFIESLLRYREKNVLISAHGNSLRVIFKILEGLSSSEAEDIEITFGKVYQYKLFYSHQDTKHIMVEVLDGVKYRGNTLTIST